MSNPALTTITTEHVDVRSTKSFEETVKDLTAELGKASTEKLMDRLSASDSWDEYAEECADFAGRSNLIEVAFLNWGRVLTLSGSAMKAKCYLPTKIFVFEDGEGVVHVSYDKFAGVMAPYGNANLDRVAGVIDGVLEKLASAAAG